MCDSEKSLVKLYCNGETYQIIGEKLGVTRERIRQKISAEIKKQIICEWNKSGFVYEYEWVLIEAIKDRLKKIKKVHFQSNLNKKKESISDVVKNLENRGIETFGSITELNDYLGKNARLVKKIYPEIYTRILNNKKKKWSIENEFCKICESTKYKHRSKGVCIKCYGKSEEHKKQIRRYHQKNGETIKKKNLVYSRRPDVRKRLLQKQLEKNFENNREKAIRRDGEKCIICGITREKHREIFGKDLFVHRRYSDSNDLENLVTLCMTCHIAMNQDNFQIL